jgi:hypothetical protein
MISAFVHTQRVHDTDQMSATHVKQNRLYEHLAAACLCVPVISTEYSQAAGAGAGASHAGAAPAPTVSQASKYSCSPAASLMVLPVVPCTSMLVMVDDELFQSFISTANLYHVMWLAQRVV